MFSPTLVLKARCASRGTTTQQLDWYDPNGLHTKAFEQQLIVGLVNSTITDLVAKEDVSYDALLGILDRWVEVLPKVWVLRSFW
jgi:hypothetical protein